MPAYEVVLRFAAREEVRLSDQPLAVGQTITVGGREWVAMSEQEAHDSFCTRRFVVVPHNGSTPTNDHDAVASGDRRQR